MKPQPAPRHIQEMALCILFDEAPNVLEGRTYIQKLMFAFQQQAGESLGRDDLAKRFVGGDTEGGGQE